MHLSLLSTVLGSLVVLLVLLLLLLRLLKRLLLLGRNLLVELVVLLVVVVLLQVLELSLPDAAEGSSGVGGDAAPGGLCAKELHALGAGGERVLEHVGGAGDAVELADVAEGVVGQDVLGDECAAVEDHDRVGLGEAAVCDDGGLSKDVLLELLAETVVDSDLDLLDDEHDNRLLLTLELVAEVWKHKTSASLCRT